MNREILAIGNTGAQLVSKFNDNFYTLNKRNWFNVEDYGAVHDNVTDDTEAIQNTINACFAAGGGTVFFPNGIYLIEGALKATVNADYSDNPIAYNSQIYIPAVEYDELVADPYKWKTIRLLGETPGYMWQDGGLKNNVLNPNHVVLRSTIAGSGTFPSVICSAGPGGYYWNYTITMIENISVTVNPCLQ